MKTFTLPKEIEKRIPDFTSYEEEATFWDTHDIFLNPIDKDDFINFDNDEDFNLWMKVGDKEYKKIKATKIDNENLTETLNVKVTPKLKKELKSKAKKMHLTASDLVRISLNKAFLGN